MERKIGGRIKTEGIYVYLWLIHVEVGQKTTKFCKEINVQFKKLSFYMSDVISLSFSDFT